MSGLRVVVPVGLAEAERLLTEEPDARLVAGGTALQLEWARGERQPKLLVDLARLPELHGIVADENEVRIGAATRLDRLDISPYDATLGSGIASTVAVIAAPSIRRLATIGGNIAGGTGCLIPTLVALGAEIQHFAGGVERRSDLLAWLDLPATHRGILVAVVLPKASVGERTFIRKIGLRTAFTPSVIGIAGTVRLGEGGQIEGIRLAVGGGIVRPQRLLRSEARLLGRSIDDIAADASIKDCLIDEIDAPSDAFRSARYRKRVAANAILAALASPSPALRERVGVRAGDRADSGVDESKQGPHPDPLPQSGRGNRSGQRFPEPPPPALASPSPALRERVGVKAGVRAAAATDIKDEQPFATVSRIAMPDRWRARPDIAAKVDGSFAYLTDHREDGMLIGRILRAGIPHALIRSIDTSAAEALPGVVAIVTARDVPGLNGYGIVFQDQPALCDDKVRYVGDAVAAVAATDAATAAKALTLIRVEYEPLPIVDDPLKALDRDAPAVHANGNLRTELNFFRGDVDAAWARCAHIVEDVYVTPRQMHGFMETEGGYAIPGADGSLLVAAGGQYALRDRLQLARILAIPEEAIRVITSPSGGAFGGKDELTVQPALALLAIKAKRPVRLQIDRAESVRAGWKRNPMVIRMRTGCDADGRLIAQEVDVVSDSGAYASLSPGVLETAMEHVCGPYVIPNVRSRGRLAYTNNGVCGAFRGFGANQMTFAIESQLGRLAEMTGLDPIEIRRINMRRAGQRGFLGQVIAPTERLDEMLDAARTGALWQARGTAVCAKGLITGTGMAMSHQGNGLGSLFPDPGGGRLSLLPDGRIEAAFGLDEMGQGVVAVIRACVATAIGCAPEDVVPVVGDTARTPQSGSTTASRGSYVAWKASTLAGPQLAADLLSAASLRLGRPTEDLAITAGGFRDTRSNSGNLLLSFADLAAGLDPTALPTASTSFEFPRADWQDGNARFIFAFGSTVAKVGIDPVSGDVHVLALEQHSAAGPVLDVAGYLGQIEGGSVQGLGFTLTEDAMMKAGDYVTRNLDSYMMPGIADAPRALRVTALETLDDEHGPRGIGELGIAAVSPAISAAIADAIGFWPATLPIAPEAVLDALERRTW